MAVEEASSPAAPLRATVREALRLALADAMRRDQRVFIIGEDIGSGGQHRVTEGLLGEFGPRRVVDAPVAEQGFTGLAVGAALAGLRPVVEFMSWSFALQAMDQIVNSAAKTRYMSGSAASVPLVLRGPDGPAARLGGQHSQCLAPLLAMVPGLKVVAPATPADARTLLAAAIEDPDPVLLLEHERLYDVEGPLQAMAEPSLAKAAVVLPGRDVTIVSYSYAVVLAIEAAQRLAEQGIAAEVVDLRSLRPLDLATVLASLSKTRRLVVVEESWPVGSIGSEICARVVTEAFGLLRAAPVRISAADVPTPYAANLEAMALPSVDQVVAATLSLCYRSPISSD